MSTIDWTRILEQIGALTVLIQATPQLAPRDALWQERQKLIDRIQADRDGKQTAVRRGAETVEVAA